MNWGGGGGRRRVFGKEGSELWGRGDLCLARFLGFGF